MTIETEFAALREELRSEFASLHAQVDGVRVRVDGLPIIGAAIETLRHDVRTLRAAINDEQGVADRP